MMLQKVIKVGNSLAVVIPADYARSAEIEAGQEVNLLADKETNTLIITKDDKVNPDLTPEFFEWLRSTSEENKGLIQRLARA